MIRYAIGRALLEGVHESPLPSAIQSFSRSAVCGCDQRLAKVIGAAGELIGHTRPISFFGKSRRFAQHWHDALAREELVRDQEAKLRDQSGKLREHAGFTLAMSLGGHGHALMGGGRRAAQGSLPGSALPGIDRWEDVFRHH